MTDAPMRQGAAGPKSRYPEQHAHFQHLFVVGRLPKTPGEMEIHRHRPSDFMLTKAFFTEDEAEQESARLNAQNGEYWSYFVRVVRLVPKGRGD